MIDYGIQTEESMIRAHVCPVVKRVYVYKTIDGIKAINSNRYRKVNGYQKGIDYATAEGYLVPPFDISGCVSISVNQRAWDYLQFDDSQNTTVKGEKAERLIVGMLRHGLFPVPVLAESVNQEDIQISGGDVFVKPNAFRKEGILIQVKCDYHGGELALGGTGNLFLQVAEINPLKAH